LIMNISFFDKINEVALVDTFKYLIGLSATRRKYVSTWLRVCVRVDIVDV